MTASTLYGEALRSPQHKPLDTEVVMPYTRDIAGHASVHEQATREQIARRVAALKDCPFSEELPQSLWPRRAYLVPSDTLLAPLAQRLGVRCEDDLLGGVVPHPFVATKAITHALVGPAAAAPEGWNPAFAEAVASAVLPGFAAFSREDALVAGQTLLRFGPVRIKPATATGGHGQTVAVDAPALAAQVAALDGAALAEHGVVLEHNLAQVDTLSVGQVRIAGMVASYYGRQHLATNNAGVPTYGGSDLTVVRGDFHALLATLGPGAERKAVDQALIYDNAARACFAGFFASRINYDVAQGLSAAGEWCSGVLEQSWRIGGATGAEVAALEAFHAHRNLHAVRAVTVERFGRLGAAPPGATVYFQGDDPEVGPLTKYAMVRTDGDAA